MIRALFIIVLFAALAPSGLAQDRTAQQLALRDIDGRSFRLGDYRGKVVLLNFWATWCAPCLAEMPELVKWQRRYRSRGLRVVGVTYPPQEAREIRATVQRLRINYPIVIGDEETKARFDNSDVLPITVIIDRRGRIREVIRGIVYAEEFDEKIKPLIEE